MAAASSGNAPSARATRTFSRAAPGSSPTRQHSQCAHEWNPLAHPPRSSKSRSMTSSS
jgi:hypothetical protein